MAEYQNPDLGVKFEIPDRLNVRQQVAFYSAVRIPGSAEEYERYWAGLLQIVEGWESELIPDPHALDMDEESDPEIATAVIWAAATAVGHMNRLEDVPKN